MAEQHKRQGKPQTTTSDAPMGDVAQANVLATESKTGGNWPYQVAPLTDIIPVPRERAKTFVHEVLELFNDDAQNISKQVSLFITSAINDCPAGERLTFRSEAKLRAERLKQFAELLYNEFVYQSASIK